MFYWPQRDNHKRYVDKQGLYMKQILAWFLSIKTKIASWAWGAGPDEVGQKPSTYPNCDVTHKKA